MSQVAWGARVSKTEPLEIDLAGCELSLDNAALAAEDATKAGCVATVTAVCKAWEEPMSLCTLTSQKRDQAPVSVGFFPNNGSVKFSVVGNGVVHLVGTLPTPVSGACAAGCRRVNTRARRHFRRLVD